MRRQVHGHAKASPVIIQMTHEEGMHYLCPLQNIVNSDWEKDEQVVWWEHALRKIYL